MPRSISAYGSASAESLRSSAGVASGISFRCDTAGGRQITTQSSRSGRLNSWLRCFGAAKMKLKALLELVDLDVVALHIDVVQEQPAHTFDFEELF